MSIETIRRAKCDQCGTTGPEALESELPVELAIAEGWVFEKSQPDLCPKCARAKQNNCNCLKCALAPLNAIRREQRAMVESLAGLKVKPTRMTPENTNRAVEEHRRKKEREAFYKD